MVIEAKYEHGVFKPIGEVKLEKPGVNKVPLLDGYTFGYARVPLT